jgi:hypothetical protein
MAGKAILGDPKVPSQFHTATGTELEKTEQSILIVCNAPHGLLARFPSLQIDMLDRVSRTLDTHGISVIPSDDVANWYDDNGEWGDFSELGQEFDADYVMEINLRKFSYQVPDSENLLQGRSEGAVRVFSVDSRNAPPVQEVFHRSFNVTFPTSYPVPRENRSDQIFMEGFMDRVALHIAQFIYDHNVSETIH